MATPIAVTGLPEVRRQVFAAGVDALVPNTTGPFVTTPCRGCVQYVITRYVTRGRALLSAKPRQQLRLYQRQVRKCAESGAQTIVTRALARE